MIKNKTARNKFQGGELTTVRTQSALFVIPLKICLYRQLPLRGVAVVLKEPLHSAPGLPDAGLILKKLLPVGKSFLLTNTPFVLLIYPDLKQNSPWWIQGEGVQNCSKYSIPYSPCFKHAYFGISLQFGSYFLWRSFEAPHPASRMQGWY